MIIFCGNVEQVGKSTKVLYNCAKMTIIFVLVNKISGIANERTGDSGKDSIRMYEDKHVV